MPVVDMGTTCSVDECGRPPWKDGLCSKCWHGDREARWQAQMWTWIEKGLGDGAS